LLIRINIIFILLLFFLFCCNERENPGNEGFSITDDIGNTIFLQRKPDRIISLAPNITETIYAVKADSILVGVTSYCNYPPEAKTKTVIGGMLDPDIEIITSLKPDIIFLTVEGNSQSVYQSLINAGFKVFVTNPRSLNGIKKMIKDIGTICGKENNYPDIINQIDSSESLLIFSEKNTVKPDALFLLSVNPLITVNNSTYINQVIELSGFRNIYSGEPLPYPAVSYEDIILKKPEYIILTTEIADEEGNYVKELGKYLNLTPAIKKNKIIICNADLISRPGPRIINAIDELKKQK